MNTVASPTSSFDTSMPGVDPLDLIARYVANTTLDDVSCDAKREAMKGVIDFLGVAMAGATHPAIRPFSEYVERVYADGGSTALTLSSGKVAEGAAFLNGVAGHVLDFDDVNDAMGGHPTVAVIPAALAVGEEVGADFNDVLTAYILGVEVVGALGLCLNKDHYERGWHPTATLGVFGAAAAAARLFGLDVHGVREALSIAASFPSGIKAQFGSSMKPGQVGFAVSEGVVAARLSALRATGGAHALAGAAHSFSNVYNFAGRVVDWTPLSELGRKSTFVTPGLWFKRYPCCGSTHAPIDAVRQLATDGQLDLGDIASIEVYVHPRRLPHTDRPSPQSALERKFSTQYVVAVAAVQGDVGLADFDDAAASKEVDTVLRKVRMLPLTEQAQVIARGRTDCWAAQVRVLKHDGDDAWVSMEVPVGSHPDAPISEADLRLKFLQTSTVLLGEAGAARALAALDRWISGDGDFRSVLSGRRGRDV